MVAIFGLLKPTFIDTSKVADVAQMFGRINTFNFDLSKMNFTSVIDDSAMISGTAISVEHLANTPNKALYAAIITGGADANAVISAYNVSNMTSFNSLFQNKTDIPDITSWNTSKVIDMGYMFANASAFNGDISSWQTANVTDMSAMFNGASLFNGNISMWDTSNVTNMSDMFKDTNSFNQDLSPWNTANVTGMSGMFNGARAFNGNISTWDTSKVTNMDSMFRFTLAFNQDISRWDTSKVANMSSMFLSARAFNQDISGWDVSSVTRRVDFALNSNSAWPAAFKPRF